jgi:hypothetical protein
MIEGRHTVIAVFAVLAPQRLLYMADSTVLGLNKKDYVVIVFFF